MVGYDAGFLGLDVPQPGPGRHADDLVPLDGADTIPYTHFSVALSRSRRLCRWVAWNIDGPTLPAEEDAPTRAGLTFRTDPRLPADVQTGEEVYVDNVLDRGHVARRADLLWGPREEAEQANRDSFTFPNITPQRDTFNQSMRHGLWGLLENAVLAEVRLEPERVSVVAGPVLADGDPDYRDLVKLPREFWKTVVYRFEDGLRARSFLLTQDVDDVDTTSPLDEFRTYEITIDELERRTGLVFPDVVHTAAALDVDQSVTTAPKQLGGLGEIRW